MNRVLVACAVAALIARSAVATPVRVKDTEELRRAVAAAKPGTRIEILPGEYQGGLHFDDLAGTKARPIVLTAADPEKPPVFKGGTSGIQLTDPASGDLTKRPDSPAHRRGADSYEPRD